MDVQLIKYFGLQTTYKLLKFFGALDANSKLDSNFFLVILGGKIEHESIRFADGSIRLIY